MSKKEENKKRDSKVKKEEVKKNNSSKTDEAINDNKDEEIDQTGKEILKEQASKNNDVFDVEDLAFSYQVNDRLLGYYLKMKRINRKETIDSFRKKLDL